MTPLHLQIALHYHSHPDQHPMLHNAVHREYAEDLVAAGMLQPGAGGLSGREVTYHATDGLAVFVEALCSTPFPVQQWVMPAPNPRKQRAEG